MQIKNPKFKEGQKVRDIEDGDIYTVESIDSYGFMQDEYWYNLEENLCVMPESALELYIEKPKSVWDLKEGDTYYLIYGDGNVSSEKKWFDEDYENNYREIGNTFLTREEAEFEVERRKIETEMLRLGGRRTFKEGENNWYIFYDFYTGHVDSDYDVYDNCGQGTIYFDSTKEVHNVIERVGKKRLKKYILGVDE